MSLEHVVQSGEIPIAYSSFIVQGFVDHSDLAILARNIIMAPTRHNLTRYELVVQDMSYDGIAGLIAKVWTSSAVSCQPRNLWQE